MLPQEFREFFAAAAGVLARGDDSLRAGEQGRDRADGADGPEGTGGTPADGQPG